MNHNRSLAMRNVLISTLVLAASVGCTNSEAANHEAELRSAIASFRQALNSGDSTSFFGLLASDLEVFAPGAQPIRGPEARAYFRPLFTQVTPEIGPFTNEEITLVGDIAIQRHSYQLSTTPKSGGAVKTITGSGLHIWKRRSDGRWQIVKDIWTNPSTL
jgi:ketosteroid isomerase-like protein